jgi:chromosome segregation ATPase
MEQKTLSHIIGGSRSLAVALAALVAAIALVRAAEEPPPPPAEVSPADAAREKELELEREEARKLRQLREERESQRREAARKREAEQARQGEIVRLRTMLMGLEQRESTLNHDVRSLQHQIDALPRSSTDQSITARRGELERQLGYSQNQLDDARRSRESASKQLDSLRFRY